MATPTSGVQNDDDDVPGDGDARWIEEDDPQEPESDLTFMTIEDAVDVVKSLSNKSYMVYQTMTKWADPSSQCTTY